MSIQIVCCQGRTPRPDEWYYRPAAFFASCRKYGFEPIVLGTNPGEFKGLGSKAKLLLQAIEDGTLYSSHLIFSDVFDVVFGDDPHRVIEEFEKMHADTVWGGERNCFPVVEWASEYADYGTSFNYLNAGFGFGKTEGFLNSLKAMKLDEMEDDHQLPDGKWVNSCDQTAWTKEFLFGETSIGLDAHCKVCLNYCEVKPEEVEISDKGIKCLETGTFPIVHHFNGGSKSGELVGPVFRKLGFEQFL